MKQNILAAAFLLLPFALAQAGGGGGGQEGQGGGDIEAQFYLRVSEVAQAMRTQPTGDLVDVDWRAFESTHLPVLPVNQRPLCLFMNGVTVARDACYFSATAQSPAHFEVYEAGFYRLPPARQRRLASHEVFRAMGIGSRDEFYALSNAVYVAMPDPITDPFATPGTVQGLFGSGVYSTSRHGCGLRLFRSQDGRGQPSWMATFVKTDPKSVDTCLALGSTANMTCGPLACTLAYGISRYKQVCSQKNSDGACEFYGGGTYVTDRYRATLTPLDTGQFNLMTTVEPHGSDSIDVRENGVYLRKEGS